MSGTLNSNRQHTLMLCAVAIDTARQNLAPLGDISSQLRYILVAERLAILCTKAANALLTAHTAALLAAETAPTRRAAMQTRHSAEQTPRFAVHSYYSAVHMNHN